MTAGLLVSVLSRARPARAIGLTARGVSYRHSGGRAGTR